MNDELVEIVGYEGLYSITEDGKVWSHPKRYGGSLRRGRWLKHRPLPSGYLRVNLCKNGKVKDKYIHRLVAEAHLSNPLNKPQINHKDGNKSNNDVSNLEYVTAKENQQHAAINGLTARGEKIANSKLIEEQVLEIRKNHISEGILKRKPWEKYGISDSHYYDIIKKESWSWLID